MEFRKFLGYYRPYRVLLAVDMLCALGAAGFSLLLPFGVRQITQDILGSGLSDAAIRIGWTGAWMVLAVLARMGCIMFYDYKGHDMGAKIERDMRRELFEHLQRQPFSFYDERHTGELMSRLTHDLTDIAELCHHLPENVMIYGTPFLGALIVLLRVDWRLTAVLCLFLPPMIGVGFVLYRRMQTAYRESRERIADVNARAEENLSGIRVVQSFTGEAAEVAKFDVQNDGFYHARRTVYKREMQFYASIEELLTPLMTVAIAVVGGFWMLDGTLSLANLLLFVLYAGYLTGPVPKLAFMVHQYQSGVSGYRRFRELMEIAPTISDREGAADLVVTEGRVTLDGVTFRYGDRGEDVLREVSLDVRPGETIALVGRSGIGKTTLCALIPRFYDTTAGEIRIDGVPIREVTLASLRRQIGVVRQETFLFSGTVLENIQYGNLQATRAEVIDAAKKAGAHDFIEALPDGYDTDIGQRGVKLSGGQQQRLSIARVFLKNPPILILDEATSALDTESERAVMESLRALSKDRTAFIIAHRLSTVRHADRVVRLTEGGVVEEEGTVRGLCPPTPPT